MKKTNAVKVDEIFSHLPKNVNFVKSTPNEISINHVITMIEAKMIRDGKLHSSICDSNAHI